MLDIHMLLCVFCNREIHPQENFRIFLPIENRGICEDCLIKEFIKLVEDNPGGIAPFVVEGLRSILKRKHRVMTISKPIRERVFFRYKNTCCQCGANDKLSIDHIKPVRLGGTDTISNLQVLCKRCNSKKGAKYGTTMD